MDATKKRTVIAVASAVAVTALIVGVAVWAVMNGRLTQVKSQTESDAARLEVLESEVQSLTASLQARAAEPTETPVPGDADTNGTEPGKTAPSAKGEEPASEDGRFFCFITKARWDGARPELTVDYAQFLTGQEAADAAAAAGEESPPPNDYFIVNDNTRLRTFPADSQMKVRMISTSEGTRPDPYDIAFGQWFDAYSGMSGYFPSIRTVPYWITVKGGVITGIEEQFLP